jgi:hypothetical protein
MQDALRGEGQTRATLLVHPKDLSWAKGISNENVRWLRDHAGLRDVALRTDSSLERGTVRVARRA